MTILIDSIKDNYGKAIYGNNEIIFENEYPFDNNLDVTVQYVLISFVNKESNKIIASLDKKWLEKYNVKIVKDSVNWNFQDLYKEKGMSTVQTLKLKYLKQQYTWPLKN